MCSRFPESAAALGRRVAAACVLSTLFAARSAAAEGPAPPERVLRVCADPNALPFSNDGLEGFENRLAELVAVELGARVDYTFRVWRRGFLRETLKACACDVVMGIVHGADMAATTRPYYRSSYAAVTRADGALRVSSLDDARLARLRIGVQLIGDDGMNSPPAHALSRRGITSNVAGYPVYGDASSDLPSSAILDAVAAREIDVAFVWGPLAGWAARVRGAPLAVTPLEEDIRAGALPLSFGISLGVRRDDQRLRRELDEALVRLQPRIDALLDAYGVPRAIRPAADGAREKRR
jgi:mxaJ protein